MHIYLDEAGTFAATGSQGSFSLVAGYVVPEISRPQVTKTLRHFKVANGFRFDTEVKRRDVNEVAYFKLLEDLSAINAVAFAVATDSATNETADQHQAAQVQIILANEPKMNFPEGRRMVREVAGSVEALSLQQYIEINCRTRLVWTIVRSASLYYAVRIPATLSAFRWRFDQKDVTRNHFDETFASITLPFTQAIARDEPLIQVRGADYSHFSRFYSDGPYPDWLPPPKDSRPDDGLIDANKIWLEHLKFVDSKDCDGVQVADLISNGIYGLLRRRFNDNERAATLLGSLMVSPERGRPVMDFIALGRGGEELLSRDTARLVNRMRASARAMVPRTRPVLTHPHERR